MSYATLMVHLDLGQKNDARLTIVGDLAERFTARVIGVAAQAEISPTYYAADGVAGFVEDDPTEMEYSLAVIKQRLQEAEERFRTALKGRARQLEWRSSLEDPVPYIASQCRAADLLVIGKTASDERQEPTAQINPSDLIGRTGRPLLIIRNCSGCGYVESTRGAPARARRIASRALMERRRAVSMTERMSA